MADFDFTEQQLAQIIPGNPYTSHWYSALVQCLPDYDITSPQRVAAFLAQCAHESGGFRAIKENLNYRAETLRKVFPKYFTTDALAQQYAHNQEAIANKVYANRMGNGSEESGDGFRYCGRGLIQLTGKQNYQNFADSIETPVEDVPAFLATFEGSVQSACWYFETNNLNRFSDAGDIRGLTKAINGGIIGLADRIKHYEHACHIFGI